MGDRYYAQMYGGKQGYAVNTKKRKRMSTLTEELEAQVIEVFQAANPTPENSMDIVNSLAEEHEQSPNGVRMILSSAGVYVKKTPAKAATKSSGGGSRVSKAEAQEQLAAAIESHGGEVDDEILGRMTGKAMMYFAEVLNAINA